MALKLQDVYVLFNNIVRGGRENDDLDRKMLGVNEGGRYLSQRMIELGRKPLDLLTDPTDFVTTINTNFIDLPSDFLDLGSFWRKEPSGDYFILSPGSLIPYPSLVRHKGPDFFDIEDFGGILLVAIKGERMYFDRHFSADGTDDVRLDYHKLPADVFAFERLNFTGLSGTFVVGEIVTGGTSLSIATIRTVGATFLEVNTSGRTGIFLAGETLTGGTSGATAIQSGDMEEKAQVLEWSKDFTLLLATAIATQYFYFIGSSEAVEKSQVVDALIKQKTTVQKPGRSRFLISRNSNGIRN